MLRTRLFQVVLPVIFAAVLGGCADERPPGSAAGGGSGGVGGGSGGVGNPTGGTGGSDAGTGADVPVGQPVALKVAWWGSADRDRRTQTVIQLFEAKHPDIDIIEEHYASTAGDVGVGYWSTMDNHAGNRTLPDVMQHDHAYIEEWAKKGLLAPLDDLIKDGSINLTDVPPPLALGGAVAANIVGITLGLNTQSIVIDVDMFKKAGLVLPTDEWTWDDFEAAALEIKKKLGVWGFGPGLYGPVLGWKSVNLSKGTWVFSPDGKSLAYQDDKPWNDHWHMILRLQRAGAIPSRAEEPTSALFADYPIVQSKAAMDSILNSNQLVLLWNVAGTARNFKLLPFPRVKDGKSPVYLKPSQYFSITATSKYPKQAAKFIDFFVNNIDANLVLLGERGVPVNLKVTAAIRPKLNPVEAEALALGERAQKYATTVPPLDPAAWGTIFSKLFVPKVVDPVMAEVWTPEMATALFRKEASDVLMGKPVSDGGAPDLRKPTDAEVEAPRDAGVDTKDTVDATKG